MNSSRLLFTLFISTLVGCSSGTSESRPDGRSNANDDRATSPLTLTTQMYFVGKGSYGDGEQYKDPTAELIKQQFESMNWNDVDERPIIKLSQKKDGKIRMIQVRRNQSSAGELHVAWIDMPDGQVFSGESTQIESPDMLLKLLLAFSDNSQEIKTMIDWDYVEE